MIIYFFLQNLSLTAKATGTGSGGGRECAGAAARPHRSTCFPVGSLVSCHPCWEQSVRARLSRDSPLMQHSCFSRKGQSTAKNGTSVAQSTRDEMLSIAAGLRDVLAARFDPQSLLLRQIEATSPSIILQRVHSSDRSWSSLSISRLTCALCTGCG